MAIKDYEFRIYSAATSAVEHTIASSNLRTAPTVLGPSVDVLKGRTQTRPWDVEINDNGDFFSAIIADSGGRMAIQGRLCDLRLNKDGAGFSVIGTGRIGDIVDHVSHYQVNVQDERWRERLATIFTKQGVVPGSGDSSKYTASILQPAGIRSDYGQFIPRANVGVAGEAFNRQTNLIFLRVDNGVHGDHSHWNQALRDLIPDDVKTDARVEASATAGNFDNLRANIDGTDFEIASFDIKRTPAANILGLPEHVLTETQRGPDDHPGYWVVDPTSNLSSGDKIRAFLHTPTAEPNELMPLHVGGRDGIAPFEALRDQYDEIGIVYSSSAMQGMIDDPDFGRAWWRITKPQNLGKWAEDHIYGPYGVVPMFNSCGEIVPTKVHLPQDVDTSTLFEFTKSNMATQPTWQHTARERVTAIRYEYTAEELIRLRPFDGDWPADMIRISDRVIERTHDRFDSGTAPRREVTYTLDGLHHTRRMLAGPNAGTQIWKLDRFVDAMSRERFERFGDGPISGTIVALSTANDVKQGDLVKINLETFPAPANQDRGATRIVQILSRMDGPAGPEFEWLDVGPNLQKLVAPSVVVAPATSDPKHTVIATISGSSSTDVGYQLQWALSTVSTGPTSTEWFDWAGQGDSTGTNTISPLPSGRQLWVRTRATKLARIRSAWGTAADTTTESLQPPTALASSSVTGTAAQLDWALGASDSPSYPLELLATTGACPSTGFTLARLPIGTTKYFVQGMVQDTTHCFTIRHTDGYGGVSADAALSVAMTSSPPVAPSMAGVGIEIAAGSTCG